MFPFPLVVEVLDSLNSKRFMVVEKFEYWRYDKTGVLENIPIPRFYCTDFASVPRWVPFTRPVGIYNKAALVHDVLCYYLKLSLQEKAILFIKHRTRKEVDDIFYEAMESLQVSKTKRWCMWLGCRAYSKITFQK